MTYAKHGRSAVDYAPCRYGNSKILFRGPKRRPERRYTAFLGGSETYGRFLHDPYPALLERASGRPSVNLGCINSGPDIYLNDPSLIEIAAGADTTVIQIVGAQNLSNRFYAVHPRRNDRFLRASRLMERLYAEVDFTAFHFTRHLLTELEQVSPAKFDVVRQELQEAWLGRMRSLIERLNGGVVLLWLSRHSPEDGTSGMSPADEPVFVTRDMLDELRPKVRGIVEVVATPEELRAGRAALDIELIDRVAASDLLGAHMHARAADALLPYLAKGG